MSFNGSRVTGIARGAQRLAYGGTLHRHHLGYVGRGADHRLAKKNDTDWRTEPRHGADRASPGTIEKIIKNTKRPPKFQIDRCDVMMKSK